MTEKMTLPRAAREAADNACGGLLAVEQVTDRRGSAVWKAAGPRGSVALKAGAGEGAVITSREADAVAALHGEGYWFARGEGADIAWLMMPWHAGPSTWEALRPVREGERSHRALRVMHDFCVAVGRLHDLGWVHSDIQPAHALHTSAGVRLVDLSWAYSEELAPSPLFRGGMVHLLAPEVAQYVEEGHRPVAINPSHEVYTVAASLWWAVTGSWPRDYARVGVDPARFTASSLRQMLADGRIPLAESEVWPAVLKELTEVMQTPAAYRPSARDLGVRLLAADL